MMDDKNTTLSLKPLLLIQLKKKNTVYQILKHMPFEIWK